jgi:hypothetical protein
MRVQGRWWGSCLTSYTRCVFRPPGLLVVSGSAQSSVWVLFSLIGLGDNCTTPGVQENSVDNVGLTSAVAFQRGIGDANSGDLDLSALEMSFQSALVV